MGCKGDPNSGLLFPPFFERLFFNSVFGLNSGMLFFPIENSDGLEDVDMGEDGVWLFRP